MNASNPPRGRPRSELSRQAILHAAFEELQERGYAAFAIEAVVVRAHVGKATVYRWWPGKPELAVDAFFHGTRAELRFPDSSSARDDFRRQILQLRRLLAGPSGAALVAMVVGARQSPSLGQALAERWVMPRKRWGIERLQRAQAEGECDVDLNIEAALDLLYGPLYARLVMELGVPSEAVVCRYVDLALSAIFLRS